MESFRCNDSRRQRHGLHDARDERDSCGFGLIAHLDDTPDRSLVEQALNALARMEHRGGIAADGLSGDGCGLLLKTPDVFLRTLAAESGIALGQRYASGLLFMPHDPEAIARVHTVFAKTMRENGLAVSGWRTVPTDDSVCGELARATMPAIEQVFVVPVLDVEGARMSREACAQAL
jgi:glutamate synthase (NADPH/NADH) large chain